MTARGLPALVAFAFLAAASLPAQTTDENQATTSVGGGTFDLNDFLGADRYYTNSTPVTGQGTITVNLEAGHIWNGHEALQHVTNFYNTASTFGGGAVAPLYDRHATWVGLFIGGRETTNNPLIKQEGMAPGTDLRSAAVATSWSGSAYALNFDLSFLNTLIPVYDATFGTADVINSSFAGGDASGTGALAWLADSYTFGNTGTLYVVSAGNSGPGSNTVGSPGSAYNVLTVGALGSANNFNTVSSFSSRGPQNFGYFVSGTNYVTVSNVRAVVDIVAPGESLTSAFYGGQTGGNNTNLAGSSNLGTNADAYTASVAGTSFAAPIVAGGSALVYSAAKTLPQLSANSEAIESMVVKSLLLTGADKTAGWSNGQASTNGVITTTQSLDWAAGAGRMNLERTFDLQVSGQRGVAGAAVGAQGSVLGNGWDFGASQNGVNNDYAIGEVLLGGSTFTTTLSWMRVREYDSATISLYDWAQANLNLSLWTLGSDNSFLSKVAESVSLYNTVEHLSFALPATGTYGLRVSYAGNTFDNTGGVWGSASYLQGYGLAWDGDIVQTLYWSPPATNGAAQWNGTSTNFATSSAGAAASSATTTNTQVVFGGSTNGSATVVVSGSRGASGLVITNGIFAFEGTNGAAITIGGGGLTSSSSVAGTTSFLPSVAIVLGAAQSWYNASAHAVSVLSAVGGAGDLDLRASSSGAILLGGTLDYAGTLANSGSGTGTNVISGSIGTNVTALYQQSAGSRLVLSASNAFAGAVHVQAGTLELSGAGGALANASSVGVSGGATLLLSSGAQVNDSAAVTLSGGTIARGSGVSEVFGNLSVTQASFLDFGAGAPGSLAFGSYSPGFLLTVNNFFAGNSLLFSSDLSSTINNSALFSFSGGFSSAWSGGTFTITAIPEPTALCAALLLVLGFSLAVFRRCG